MRKEFLLAIFIGLGFGLIITYGVYQARLSLNNPEPKPSVSSEVTPTPASENMGKLAIFSPEDEIIQKDSSLSVTGSTLPNNYVVVFINNEEMITTADESGNFSVEVELEEGSNIIAIHTVDEDGNVTKERRTVIVSSESLVEETISENNEATDSAETEI